MLGQHCTFKKKKKKVKSTYLFITSEPLVFEDTCALSTDTQSHLMVHRHTHGDGVAHYDNF